MWVDENLLTLIIIEFRTRDLDSSAQWPDFTDNCFFVLVKVEVHVEEKDEADVLDVMWLLILKVNV